MFDLIDCCKLVDWWFDLDKLVEDDSKAKGKALELEKLLVAYVADDEAHVDRFDGDVEMRLCYDEMRRSIVWDSLGLIQTGSFQACW